MTHRQSAEGRGIADPVDIAVQRERSYRLHHARQKLNPDEQFILEEFEAGTRDSALAEKLGVSIVTVRRWRAALMAKLRLRLEENEPK